MLEKLISRFYWPKKKKMNFDYFVEKIRELRINSQEKLNLSGRIAVYGKNGKLESIYLIDFMRPEKFELLIQKLVPAEDFSRGLRYFEGVHSECKKYNLISHGFKFFSGRFDENQKKLKRDIKGKVEYFLGYDILQSDK